MDLSQINPQFKTEVDNILQRVVNGNEISYTFSSSLSKFERQYIHEKCLRLGLKSCSHGTEPNRSLTICGNNKIFEKKFEFSFNGTINDYINASCTIYKQEKPPVSNEHSKPPVKDQRYGKFCRSKPVQVPPARPNKLSKFRENLPIWKEKDRFLHMLNLDSVIIITSETGSGKTTQIPQFILEKACQTDSCCKVICTQPRRLSTIAVAERVAAERGEELGRTVGYQVKLETKIGFNSSLIYCTNGVLLRTLMDKNENLENITHIIVDEIHERDKYTDFLLISLRRRLHINQSFKLILMSATADVDLFRNYFNSVQVLHITGRQFNVKTYYKDEILELINRQACDIGSSTNTAHYLPMTTVSSTVSGSNNTACNNEFSKDVSHDNYLFELDEIQRNMNETILESLNYGSEDSFNQLLMLIVSEEGNVNHQTAEGCTPLIAAAVHGNATVVEELLSLGADLSLKYQGKTVLQHSGSAAVTKLLLKQQMINSVTTCNEPVDYNLIIKIILLTHTQYNDYSNCSVLVFLPGYDEILTCHQKLLECPLINCKEFAFFMLHSCLDIKTQYNVFNVIENKQKIILSTNISETSITIPDISFVIDCGLVKEKIHNFTNGTCALQTIYISQASAKQRRGRAGRTKDGICFCLYSIDQYNRMSIYNTPEILRTPLHEMCLHIKLLAHTNEKISDYLLDALEPPPTASIQNAVSTLINLGALTENETLTTLGKHLLKISIEPRLAKMLLFATIFKCIDPILTIVACLDFNGELFFLPQSSTEKSLARLKVQQFAEDTMSDHFSFLRAFQTWQNAKIQHNKSFMREYNINSASMEMVHQTRSYLLSQLRAVGFISTRKPFDIHAANEYSHCWPIVKAVLALGCYPNVAFAYREKFATKVHRDVVLPKYSSISHLNPKKSSDVCVIYEELIRYGSKCVIKKATAVTPLTIALMCGDEIKTYDKNLIQIDNVTLEHRYDNLQLFCLALSATLAHIIANPFCILSIGEKTIMNTLRDILVAEEQSYKIFGNPVGLGVVPKLFSTKLFDISINSAMESLSKCDKYLQNHQSQLKSSNHAFTASDLQHNNTNNIQDLSDIKNSEIKNYNRFPDNSIYKPQTEAQNKLLHAISSNSANYKVTNEAKTDQFLTGWWIAPQAALESTEEKSHRSITDSSLKCDKHLQNHQSQFKSLNHVFSVPDIQHIFKQMQLMDNGLSNTDTYKLQTEEAQNKLLNAIHTNTASCNVTGEVKSNRFLIGQSLAPQAALNNTEEKSYGMFDNTSGLGDRSINNIADRSSKCDKYLQNYQSQFKTSNHLFTASDPQHSLQQKQLMYHTNNRQNQYTLDMENSDIKNYNGLSNVDTYKSQTEEAQNKRHGFSSNIGEVKPNRLLTQWLAPQAALESTEEQSYGMFDKTKGLCDRSINSKTDSASKCDNYLQNHQNQFKSSNQTTVSNFQHSFEPMQQMYQTNNAQNQYVTDMKNSEIKNYSKFSDNGVYKPQTEAQNRLLHAISSNSANYTVTDKPQPNQDLTSQCLAPQAALQSSESHKTFGNTLSLDNYLKNHQSQFESYTRDSIFIIFKATNSNYLLQDSLGCSLPMAQKILKWLMKKYCVFIFFIIPFEKTLSGLAQVVEAIYPSARLNINWISYASLPYIKIRNFINPVDLKNEVVLDYNVGKQLFKVFLEVSEC